MAQGERLYYIIINYHTSIQTCKKDYISIIFCHRLLIKNIPGIRPPYVSWHIVIFHRIGFTSSIK